MESSWECLFESQKATGAIGNLNTVSYGSSGSETANGIKIDPNGNVIIAGVYSGDVEIGDTILNSVDGSEDVFIIKFNNYLEPIWVRSAGGSGDDQAKECSRG